MTDPQLTDYLRWRAVEKKIEALESQGRYCPPEALTKLRRQLADIRKEITGMDDLFDDDGEMYR
jgi:hypothetical protein